MPHNQIDDWNAFVSNWNGDKQGLVEATGQLDYPSALLFLHYKGIKHPDLERYGLTDFIEQPAAKHEVKSNDLPQSMGVSSKVTSVGKAQSGETAYNNVPDGAERVSGYGAIQVSQREMFKEEKHEFSIPEIVEMTPSVNTVELAVELARWITTNVEQFIDNQESVFRMYLSIKSDMGMPACSVFQRLYLSVPDVDEANGITPEVIDSLYDALDSKLAEAKVILSENKEFNELLFNRMAYFYELMGFVVKDGVVQQAMTRKMQGKISINELFFDPTSFTTTVTQGIGKSEDGKVVEGDIKAVIKQEELPAGFGIELEISIKAKGHVPLAMY
jgi:hypothetical protein